MGRLRDGCQPISSVVSIKGTSSIICLCRLFPTFMEKDFQIKSLSSTTKLAYASKMKQIESS